jgi:hypothetical protein
MSVQIRLCRVRSSKINGWFRAQIQWHIYVLCMYRMLHREAPKSPKFVFSLSHTYPKGLCAALWMGSARIYIP